MKKVLLTVICLTMVLFWANALQADEIDGIFQFFKAGVAPEIDGIMDDVWKSASTERMIRKDVNDAAEQPENYNDLYATVRAMWDAENIYLFFQATDADILTTLGNRYENDSFEFFFDGDHSRGSAYDGWDDVQGRIMWNDLVFSDVNTMSRADNPFDTTGIKIGLCEWEYPEFTGGDAPRGWNCEVKVPIRENTVDIEPEAESLFGFETQLNENDGAGSRENMLRWWGNSNNGWNTPSLWGEAQLSEYVASPVLQIIKASAAPTIDGELDDAWIAPQIDMSTYVVREGVNASGFAELEDSTDFYMSFRAMWDDENLYFFVNVIDELIVCDTTSGSPWDQDGVEICIDGENNKKATVGHDVNDKQYRWIYGIKQVATSKADAGTWAWKATDDGYNFELKLPNADLLFLPEDEHLIGLEIQINDNDGHTPNARDNMARWWGDDNAAWNLPAMWGTAVLVEAPRPFAIDGQKVTKARRFELSQNYPNPFNASTSISYTIEKSGMVKLTVFDMVGKEVATLVNAVKNPGDYKVTFDGSNLSTGIYFYRLETGSNVATQKMMLLK